VAGILADFLIKGINVNLLVKVDRWRDWRIPWRLVIQPAQYFVERWMEMCWLRWSRADPSDWFSGTQTQINR
jgi:hypothetical protein